MPLNVMDFGAVGDGTTDDTSAIQAALDAALSGEDVLKDLTTARDLNAAGGYRQTIEEWYKDNVAADTPPTEMSRQGGRWIARPTSRHRLK